MKKPSSDLHDLVQSLARPDKIYFKMFLKRHVGGDIDFYSKFFNILDSQSEYDEALVKTLLGNKFNSRHFATQKLRLYNLILKSICNRTEGITARDKVSEKIKAVEILRERGLFDQAKKLIDKVKRHAADFDLHFEELRILELLRSVLKDGAFSKVGEQLERCAEESRRVMNYITAEQEYQHLYDRIFTLVRSAYSEEPNRIEVKIQEQMQSPLLTDESKAITFNCKRRYCAIHAVTSGFWGDYQTELMFCERIVELWEDTPHRKEAELLAYLRSLANLASCYLKVSPFNDDGYQRIIQKFQNTKSKSFDEEAEIFQSVCHLRLSYALHFVKLDGIVEEIPHMLLKADKYKGKIDPSRLLLIYLNITSLQFMLGNFDESSDTSLKILKWMETNSRHDFRQRNDVRVFAQLIFAISQLEMGAYQEWDALLQRPYRVLLNTYGRESIQKDIVLNLRKLSWGPEADKTKNSAVFTVLLEQFRTADSDAPKHGFLGITEIHFWVESKAHKGARSRINKKLIKVSR